MVENEARCFAFIEFEDRNYEVRGQKGQAVIFYSHNLDGQSGILRRFGVGGLNLIWVGGGPIWGRFPFLTNFSRRG